MRTDTKLIMSFVTLIVGFYIIFKLPLPFDKSQWDKRCNGNFPLFIPHRMADRLISTDVLIGKNTKEITEMLGEPTPFKQWKNQDIVYCLGAQRGPFPIDNEWLILRLDDSGRVSQAKTVSD